MCRPLLLALFVGVLALSGVAVRTQLVGRAPAAPAIAQPVEGEGMLAVSEDAVRFTLYWPEEADRMMPLVIFAADARAAHPRPLRTWARAAAASGVAAAYLEPSGTPEEAAERLRAVLAHHGEFLGIDGTRVWTWVEGRAVQGEEKPPSAPCGQSGVLATVVASAEHQLATAGHLVRRALDFTVSTRCPLAGTP